MSSIYSPLTGIIHTTSRKSLFYYLLKQTIVPVSEYQSDNGVSEKATIRTDRKLRANFEVLTKPCKSEEHKKLRKQSH